MPSRGEAGRRGDRVRSDCWIAVEMRESGGLAVDVQSKVNTLYGDDIRSLVTDGAVGIGTSYPANELSVVGDVDISGRVGIGIELPRSNVAQSAGVRVKLVNDAPPEALLAKVIKLLFVET